MLAIGGGVITTLLGEWNIALEILLIFVVIDYLTGVAAAFKVKTLTSAAGYEGIMKKAAIFMVVILAAQLDRIARTPGIFASATSFFFIANEGLSILENVGKLGVHIPSFIRNRLEQLRAAHENTDIDGLAQAPRETNEKDGEEQEKPKEQKK